MDAEQRRAWRALNLGPLWMLHGPPPEQSGPAPAAAASSPSEATQSAESAAATANPLQTQTVPVPAASAAPVADARGTDINAMDFAQLQQEVSTCTRCGLCNGRKQTVFGVGDPRPNWLIVGEAPGAQEDREGEPFVGEAGQLLNAMLGAVGAARGKGVYIVNVLKCRPPGNRDPEPEEVASCAAFLTRQIELLEPQLIFVMGRFAAQTLLKTERGIGALRNQVHQLSIANRQIPLVAGYHPAYLLRRPEEKAKAWSDICLAMSVVAPAAA